MCKDKKQNHKTFKLKYVYRRQDHYKFYTESCLSNQFLKDGQTDISNYRVASLPIKTIAWTIMNIGSEVITS